MARTCGLILPFQPALHRLSSINETIQNAPQTLWNAPNHEFRVQWGGSGAFVAKNFRCDFIAQTCPLLAPFQPIVHRISCSNETLPNAPNTTKCSKTWVWGPMGWIGCVRCEKFRCDIMAQICALIELVQPVLHQVSCSNGTLTNTPKHYESHKNMSLGSNGVDRVRSLPKITMRLRGTNFCINCTSSSRFAPSFMQ